MTTVEKFYSSHWGQEIKIDDSFNSSRQLIVGEDPKVKTIRETSNLEARVNTQTQC